MMDNRDCPKCRSRMEPGFILDMGHGTANVSTWQGGEPKKSFWSGVRCDRVNQTEITTFRCGRCGFLESYALAPSRS